MFFPVRRARDRQKWRALPALVLLLGVLIVPVGAAAAEAVSSAGGVSSAGSVSSAGGVSSAGSVGAAGGVGSAGGVSSASVTAATVDVWAPTATDAGVANARAADIDQAVAVLDRTTGTPLAGADGDQVFDSQSILKLFTAAWYIIQADGQPDADEAALLRRMIVQSDNAIQSDLWRATIVPTIADRYGLANTRNAVNASARNWGSGRITADDQVQFLFRMSQDPMVGPLLMSWMAATEPTGSDGFDQAFGLNALTGDHGSKQGWSDTGSVPYNIHSVGWTGQYFVAILQESDTASSATMARAATYTASLLTEAATQAAASQTAQNRAVVDACVPGDGLIWPAMVRFVFPAVASVLPGGADLWCAV